MLGGPSLTCLERCPRRSWRSPDPLYHYWLLNGVGLRLVNWEADNIPAGSAASRGHCLGETRATAGGHGYLCARYGAAVP